MSDKHRRSVVKAILYRGGSVLVLGIVSWVTTRDLLQTTAIAIGYQAFSLVGYYVYERIWGRIKWGK